jgi:plastocyanin
MPADSPASSDRGFTLFIATLALVISMGALLAVAFKMSSDHTRLATATSMPMMTSRAAVEDVKMTVKSDEEKGRKGPDGSWHDAVLPADFSVKAGSMVRVTVYNYDEGEHTFTAPGLGADVTIAAGSEAKPAVTTFTFRAPQKAGRYEWFCALPCDPWAMNQDGFMRGEVSVT